MHTSKVLISLCVILVSACFASAQTLIWSDEFDGSAVDTDCWTFQTGGGGWGNGELQVYEVDNASVSGGALIITAERSGDTFTSARLNTGWGNFEFQYGTVEVRIRIPDLANGLWPAFWGMGATALGWPDCGEVDIMEMGTAAAIAAGTVNRTVVSAAHWEHEGGYAGYGLSYDAPSDLNNDYHIWTMTWTPTMISTYLDGAHIWSFDISGGEASDLEEFHRPYYFLLNTAVGGYFTGITDPGGITAPFPAELYIDYIRVYDNGYTTNVITCGGDPGYCDDGTCDPGEDQCNCPEDCGTPPATETNCTDGDDNDCDLDTDCDDSDCDSDPACSQLPFYGTPQAIPGQIEAEDFDIGPNGVAYYDYDAGNNGGQYRDTDVDIEACTDTGGGYDIGWMSASEWMDYQVDVAAPGSYTIECRVASNSTGGNFHIEFGGVDKTGNISVPVTGGWQNWVTVSTVADLSAGPQEMTFVNATSADEYNLNYFNFTSVSSYCDDGTCDPGEDQCNCPEDCGTPPATETNCTDGIDEDCDLDTDCDDSDCDGDPACYYCGDTLCTAGEDQCNCPGDCGTPPATETNCTDEVDNDCDTYTDCDDSDCDGDPACPDFYCGDGTCDPGEDCSTCPSDCISRSSPPKHAYCCGDGTCEGAENSTNCAVDCGSGPVCGDETCDPGEDQCNCPDDCGTPPATETDCTDGIDEDCDGEADCLDPTGDCDLDPACDCLDNGASCSDDSECCSNKCRGGKCR